MDGRGDKPSSVVAEFLLSRVRDKMSGTDELFATGGSPIDKRSSKASAPDFLV